MTTPAPEKLITGEEFERMPESRNHELIDGRLVPVIPGGGEHSYIAGEVLGLLREFVKPNRLGRLLSNDPGFYVRRSPDRVRGPDVAFIPADRVPESGLPTGFMDIVPILTVDIVSPGDLAQEVDEKVADLLAFGVERVWLVQFWTRTVMVRRPDGSAHVYGERDTLTSDDAGFGVEGFALPVADIFR